MILPNNRNPRYNSTINPRYNSTINPRFNSTINPRFNSTINPRFNSTINPRFNSTINPRYNSTINPRYNSTINPRYNSTINPRYNSVINPNKNINYEGLYVFDLNSNPIEFIIFVNETIIQIFDFELSNTRFGVKHMANGYILFNENNNEYCGHLEFDLMSGYNEFDLENNWVCFVK